MYNDQHVYHRQVMLRYQLPTPEQTLAEFTSQVAAAFGESPEASDFAHFTTEVLLDYIRRTHVFYLSTKLPEIGQTIYSLSNGNAADKTLLTLLEASFTAYYRMLESHIREEETLLLPYISQLCNSLQDGPGSLSPLLLHGSQSIEAFEETHTDTEGELVQMRAIVQLYQPASENTSLYRILVSQLENFEADLNVHAFIEDEVLIPRAKQLESRLLLKLAERNGRV